MVKVKEIVSNNCLGPGGLFVDSMGSVYVVDQGNDRVMRWLRDAKEGSVIVGGNGRRITRQSV